MANIPEFLQPYRPANNPWVKITYAQNLQRQPIEYDEGQYAGLIPFDKKQWQPELVREIFGRMAATKEGRQVPIDIMTKRADFENLNPPLVSIPDAPVEGSLSPEDPYPLPEESAAYQFDTRNPNPGSYSGMTLSEQRLADIMNNYLAHFHTQGDGKLPHSDMPLEGVENLRGGPAAPAYYPQRQNVASPPTDMSQAQPSVLEQLERIRRIR